MNELSIELHMDSNKYLYEQIYEHIKNEIRAGKLLQGEKLPSTRSLAGFLQISRSTVDLAYEQLISEGYVESKPYRGYYICPVEDLFLIPLVTPEEKETVAKSISNCKYDFSPNGIEMRAFPLATWRKISKSTLNDDRKQLFQLGNPRGDVELRATIGRYLHSSRGVVSETEQIIVGAGNDYLLMLLKYVLGDHCRIAMENPTYMRAYRIFKSFGYEVSGISMDDSGININELNQCEANVAYVMPSHQYPTGIVMPIGRRMELLKWAGENEDRYLIEDDYDSEFRYRGKPIPALQASDCNEKVIYMGTFSKSIAPAIRVSYMVLPKKLLKIYIRECSFFSSTVSRLDQSILNEFIRDGYFERYLNKMRKIYKGKHDVLMQGLKQFDEHFIVSGENGGLHILLENKGTETEDELIEKAARQGVKVYGLKDASIGERKHSHSKATVILGYAGLLENEIEDGLDKLKKAWL
ncbi:MAG TPA: PLP-dependent aminotransferase family protein [Lachnospiraceae bacterium]|nr:PLP-dependent aminotransferase family protein [Lachnospiraceae bacterium]